MPANIWISVTNQYQSPNTNVRIQASTYQSQYNGALYSASGFGLFGVSLYKAPTDNNDNCSVLVDYEKFEPSVMVDGNPSYTVKNGSSYGSYRAYQIIVHGGWNNGAMVRVYAESHSRPSKPTVVSVPEGGVAPDSEVVLSWSGAKAGAGNAITGYKIYSCSEKNGTYSYVKTVGVVSSTMVTAPSTMETYLYYKVETIGTIAGLLSSGLSDVYATLVTWLFSAVTAPITLALSSVLLNPTEEVNISWSGAESGLNNAISKYEVYKLIGGETYSLFKTVLANVSSVTDVVGDSGVSFSYKVKTIGTKVGFDSGFSIVKTVKSNTAPTKPLQLMATPALYESGGITLTFPTSSDVDGNLSHYQVQRRLQSIASGWGSWTNLNTDLKALTLTDYPIIDRGGKAQYQVKAHDALGLYSDYVQSIQVVRNSTPMAPVEGFPSSNKSTYNRNPYFRVYAPPEPDGTGQTLQMAIDAGEYTNISSVPSGGSNVRTRAGANLSVGAHTIKFRTVDATGGVGPALTLTVNILSTDYARELTVGNVIAKKGSHFIEDIFVSAEGAYNGDNAEFGAGHTFAGDVFEVTGNAGISHQTEIYQLYQQVNNTRTYYGLSPIAIPSLVGDHANPGVGHIGMFAAWGNQMMTLRSSLGDTWPINGISAMMWVPCTNGMYPLASVINQIRDRIQAG